MNPSSLIWVGVACILGVAFGDLCPGGQASCASGMTCCMLPSGQEGCCPYTNATCCPDQVHCCPMGTICSTERGGHCQDQFGTNLAWQSTLEESLSTQSNISVAVTILGNEMCSDGSQCPDDSTCCAMKDGRFGCCPFSGAVCCSDKLHCCPEGTRCDNTGHCNSQQVELKYSTGNSTWGVSIDCPGEGFKCPQGNTCCSVGKGDWGCCPLPSAMCCADQETCCPNGYRCVGAGGCAKQ